MVKRDIAVTNDSFDAVSLYGRNTGFSDKSGECRIYGLNNETGAGMITVYNVFAGITAVFNDIHMGCCIKDQSGSSGVIEINHCMEGRYECLRVSAPLSLRITLSSPDSTEKMGFFIGFCRRTKCIERNSVGIRVRAVIKSPNDPEIHI